MWKQNTTSKYTRLFKNHVSTGMLLEFCNFQKSKKKKTKQNKTKQIKTTTTPTNEKKNPS